MGGDGGTFCCTGCALVGRVPVDSEGQFPINLHVIAGLTVGVLVFNQLLFAGLGTQLSARQRPLGGRFLTLSAVLAFVVWAAMIGVQRYEKAGRRRDLLVSALTLFVLISCFHGVAPAVWTMLIANVALLVWHSRGLFRRRT